MPVGQNHVSKSAPVLVEAVGLKGDLFTKDKSGSGLLGSLAVGLTFLGQSIPWRREGGANVPIRIAPRPATAAC